MKHLTIDIEHMLEMHSVADLPDPDPTRISGYRAANKIAAVFSAGRVGRYHIHHCNMEQNVADHSFGVAAIVAILWPYASAGLLKAAIFHDVAEIQTGDTPGPVKRRHPALKAALEEAEHTAFVEMGIIEHHESSLSPEEKKKLKAADYIEAMLYCMHEDLSGNRHLNYAIENCYNYIMETGVTEAMVVANCFKLKHEAFMGRGGK